MVDSAAGAVRCARIADAGRRGPKEDSASGTDSFGLWRSCAARRVQMAVPVVESTIWWLAPTAPPALRFRRTRPRRARGRAAAAHGQQVRDPLLPARGRHELRRTHRLQRGRADARGEPGADAAADQGTAHRDGGAAATRWYLLF